MCYQHRNTVWAPKTAYDENYAQYSPGSILLSFILERLCSEPAINRLHMMSSAEWLKRWHPSEEQYYRFRLFNSSFKSLMLYNGEALKRRLDSWLHRLAG
jgi:hypothetical protein